MQASNKEALNGEVGRVPIWKLAIGCHLLQVVSAVSYTGGVWVEAFVDEFGVSLVEASAVSATNNAGFCVGCFAFTLAPCLVESAPIAILMVALWTLVYLVSSVGSSLAIMLVSQGVTLGVTCAFFFMFALAALNKAVPAGMAGKITGFVLCGNGVGLLVRKKQTCVFH